VVQLGGARIADELARQSMEDLGVARYKLPEHLVLTDRLPASNVGKIDKKALRADIAQRLSAAPGS
jgi:2,3-dihydroxybenzoate-AMP ligase